MTETPEDDGRRGDVAALLRHISAGLASWRLFPGQVERPEYLDVVDRVQEAARAVVRFGPVRVEVHVEAFSVDGMPLPSNPHLERLARACYDRRVTHVDIRQVLETSTLRSLFEVLTRPVEELDAGGGAGQTLLKSGVSSIVLWAGNPEPLVAPRAMADPLEAGAWMPSVDELDVVLDPAEYGTGTELYSELAELIDQMPQDVTARSRFYERAREAATALPSLERTEFETMILEKAGTDPFAERYLGHLRDPNLAELVLDVARAEGADPVELAQRVVAESGRHIAVVRLVEAATGSATEGGGVDPSDLHGILDEYPTDPARMSALAIEVLGDYGALELDEERLLAATEVLYERLREACREFDVDHVRVLATGLQRLLARVPAERASVVAPFRDTLVDADLVAELMSAAGTDEVSDVARVLEPLGAAAVEAVLEDLATETRGPTRRVLVRLLSKLGAEHIETLVSRLGDPRWFVVRNIATVLGQIGGPRVLDPLLALATHEHPRVRAEAARSLVTAAGDRGVQALARRARGGGEIVHDLLVSSLGTLPRADAAAAIAELARTAPTAASIRRDLDVLAAHEHPAAAEHLATLGTRSGSAGLGWAGRRRARKLARRLGKRS